MRRRPPRQVAAPTPRAGTDGLYACCRRTSRRSPGVKFNRQELHRQSEPKETIEPHVAKEPTPTVAELLDAFRQSLKPDEEPVPTTVVRPTVTSRTPPPPPQPEHIEGLEEVSLAAIDVQKMLAELELHKNKDQDNAGPEGDEEETEEAAEATSVSVPALSTLEETCTKLEQNMERLESQVAPPALLGTSGVQLTKEDAIREFAATKIQSRFRGYAVRRTIDRIADADAPVDAAPAPAAAEASSSSITQQRYDALEARVLALAKQQISFQQEVVAMQSVLTDQVSTLRAQLLESLKTLPAVASSGRLPLSYTAPAAAPTPLSAEVESTEQFLRTEQEARMQAAAESKETEQTLVQEQAEMLLKEQRMQQEMRERREEEELQAAQQQEKEAMQAQIAALKREQQLASQQQPATPTPTPAPQEQQEPIPEQLEQPESPQEPAVVVETGGVSTPVSWEVYRTPPRAVREKVGDGAATTPPPSVTLANARDLASEILMDRATPPVSPVACTPSPPKAAAKSDKAAAMDHVKVVDVLNNASGAGSIPQDCPEPRDSPLPAQQAKALMLAATPTRVRPKPTPFPVGLLY